MARRMGKAGDEGAIVEIIPDPQVDTPHGYLVEIVTPTDDSTFPACRIVCCSSCGVEVIWTPDE